MNLMDALIFLIVGGCAGWLAGVFTTGKGFGVVGNVIVGVIGAAIGSFLFGILGLFPYTFVGGVVMTVVGALVLTMAVRMITRNRA